MCTFKSAKKQQQARLNNSGQFNPCRRLSIKFCFAILCLLHWKLTNFSCCCIFLPPDGCFHSSVSTSLDSTSQRITMSSWKLFWLTRITGAFRAESGSLVEKQTIICKVSNAINTVLRVLKLYFVLVNIFFKKLKKKWQSVLETMQQMLFTRKCFLRFLKKQTNKQTLMLKKYVSFYWQEKKNRSLLWSVFFKGSFQCFNAATYQLRWSFV